MLNRTVRFLPPLIALGLPLAAALITLQTVINGSDHPAMIDVGETQIVLNVWGTLHATGYPLYVMIAPALNGLLRAVGVDAITAPALTSWLFGAAALALLYAMLCGVLRVALPGTGRQGAAGWLPVVRQWIAAACTAAYGLTRMVWLHHSIAEIYAFTLLIIIGLYALALHDRPVERASPSQRAAVRVAALALLGGIGVAHHRAIAMLVPALLIAAWPDVRTVLAGLGKRRTVFGGRGLPALAGLLALGLIGFAAYLYLPLRAQAGAAWVYGQPETWPGLWDQFTGREAARFIGGVRDLDGLIANARLVTDVLIADFGGGLPGLALIAGGLAGLGAGMARRPTRRAAAAITMGGLTAYVFHVLAYTDVLAALIVIVTLAICCGWAWGLAALSAAVRHPRARPLIAAGMGIAWAATCIGLIATHGPAIAALTGDRSAAEAVRLAADTPPGSTLMIPWGTRHFAVGFANDVQRRFDGLTLLDHTADLVSPAAADVLYTPDYTFYDRPPAWWTERLGVAPVLAAAAPGLIQVTVQPQIAPLDSPSLPPDVTQPDTLGVRVLDAVLTCEPDRRVLRVDWQAGDPVPAADRSVFVHLRDATGALIGQDDRAAPVYGLRPLTGWLPGEVVRDVYTLSSVPLPVSGVSGAIIVFGLYYQRYDGVFVNDSEWTVSAECPIP